MSFSNGSLYLILFGALFLIVIMFMPQGIVNFVRERMTKKADRERAAVESNELVTTGAES